MLRKLGLTLAVFIGLVLVLIMTLASCGGKHPTQKEIRQAINQYVQIQKAGEASTDPFLFFLNDSQRNNMIEESMEVDRQARDMAYKSRNQTAAMRIVNEYNQRYNPKKTIIKRVDIIETGKPRVGPGELPQVKVKTHITGSVFGIYEFDSDALCMLEQDDFGEWQVQYLQPDR